MAKVCGGASTGAAGGTSASNVIQYSDCPELSCDCIPVVGGKKSLSSGASVNLTIDTIGASSITVLSAPSWATAVAVGNVVNVTGNATGGRHTLVYELKNECSQDCLVIELDVASVCVPPANIIQDLAFSETSGTVSTTIQIPANSTVVSHSLPFAPAIYGSELVVSGTFTEPYPTSYTVSLSTDCGDYTVSGNINVCRIPRLLSNLGTSKFEKGFAALYSWVFDGDIISLVDRSILPSGLSWGILPNTPVAGKTTVNVTGTPDQDPSVGKMTATVKGFCGDLKIEKTWTQAPCRPIRKIGESGSNNWAIGTAVNYCHTYESYSEVELVSSEEVPQGLQVSLNKTSVAGAFPSIYEVCITGTPTLDPCEENGKTVCSCVLVKIKNDCGEQEFKLCNNLDTVVLVKPTYCIGVVKFTRITGIPGSANYPSSQWKIEVYGVVPNSVVQVANANITQIQIDNTGYGAATGVVTAYAAPVGCYSITLTHPTCALALLGGVSGGTYCNEPPIDGGTGN